MISTDFFACRIFVVCSIRLTQREAYEREIRGLQDARDAAVAERLKLSQLHANVAGRLGEATRDHAEVVAALNSQLAELRAQLQSQTLEVHMLRSRAQRADQAVVEAKRQAERNEVLLEQCRKHEVVVRTMQDQLSTYEQLECELDLAIMQAGREYDGSSASESLDAGSVRGIDVILSRIGAAMPASNKRRIKQSILLAQQLAERQKEVDALREAAQQSDETAAQLKEELSRAQSYLAKVQQPHGYLVDALRSRDREVFAANRVAREAEQQLARCEARCLALQRENQSKEDDVRALLLQADRIEGLRAWVKAKKSNAACDWGRWRARASKVYTDGADPVREVGGVEAAVDIGSMAKTVPARSSGRLPPRWVTTLSLRERPVDKPAQRSASRLGRSAS